MCLMVPISHQHKCICSLPSASGARLHASALCMILWYISCRVYMAFLQMTMSPRNWMVLPFWFYIWSLYLCNFYLVNFYSPHACTQFKQSVHQSISLSVSQFPSLSVCPVRDLYMYRVKQLLHQERASQIKKTKKKCCETPYTGFSELWLSG